jgi:tetratricopeptide (TPR) repeat protein
MTTEPRLYHWRSSELFESVPRSSAGVYLPKFYTACHIFLILFCLIGVGAAINFDLHVHGPHKPDAKTNYYLVLKTKEKELKETLAKSNGKDRDTQRQLAVVLCQNLKYEPAGKYLQQIWKDMFPQANKKYDSDYIDNACNLAGIYLEAAAFPAAEEAYQDILAYEIKFLPANDKRIGRDYNNLGLAYFMEGSNQADPAKKKKIVQKSLSYYQAAENIFRSNKDCDSQLTFNLQNQSLACAELHQKENSDTLIGEVQRRIAFWHVSGGMLGWVDQLLSADTN